MEPAKSDEKDLDLSGAARGVWLVKVPKYLSQRWKNADGNGQVGKLRISKPRFAGGKPEVVFSLDHKLAESSNPQDKLDKIPIDHKFVLTGISNQTLAIMSQNPDDSVSVEGKIIQRAECRPIGDSNYMKLKRTQLELTNKPQREVVQLTRVVQNYKPSNAATFNRQQEREKKEEGKKIRVDKDKVTEMLFAAFEKHQYYNLKDLVRLTQQPVTYLKEILKEMCTYNMKAPHRNMWELKAEYRHYKDQS